MNPKSYKTGLAPGQDAYSQDAVSRVFSVPEEDAACRLDAFLGAVLREDGFSREKIKQAIIESRVSRNGKICSKPNTKIFPGDEITALLPAPATTPEAEAGELSVIWRDEYLAVCDKPANLTVHPAPGLNNGTLVNRLLHHFPEVAGQGGLRPGIVHRLDKDTSGLMLIALTEKTRLALSRAFAARTVRKEYLALVYGVPAKPSGAVDAPIGRSLENKTKMAVIAAAKGGRPALSEYAVLHADPRSRFSLVRVRIHTGRTHQIRVHMRHIGHPLLGDCVYALPNMPALPDSLHRKAKRQMLHAWKLAFIHPETGAEMIFFRPPPEDFTSLAEDLALPMQRIIVTGSPGGGKSTFTKTLEETGLPAWSADEAVKKLYEKGADGCFLLQRRFGRRFVPNENAGVDKKALFAAMLESEELRLEIEHLVHPLVRNDLENFWREQEEKGQPAAVAEIPLALETGWLQTRRKNAEENASEILVTVYCPFAVRRERLQKNRGWPDGMIAAMEAWQWPEDKKVSAADLVVDNSGSLEDFQRRSKDAAGVLASLREKEKERVRQKLAALWAAPSSASPPQGRLSSSEKNIL